MDNKILKFNKQFVEERRYEQFITSKYPDRKIAIVSCMDTRLVELLPTNRKTICDVLAKQNVLI